MLTSKFIQTLLIFIFLNISIFLKSENSFLLDIHKNHKDAYNRISKVSMNLWTRVDLIRAINITKEQKVQTLEDELVDSVLGLYSLVRYGYDNQVIFERHIDQLIIIMQEIHYAFKEIFASIDTSVLTTTLCVLQKIEVLLYKICDKTDNLKAPSDGGA